MEDEKRRGRYMNIKFDREKEGTAAFEKRLAGFSEASGLSSQKILMAALMAVKNVTVHMELEEEQAGAGDGIRLCASLAQSPRENTGRTGAGREKEAGAPAEQAGSPDSVVDRILAGVEDDRQGGG